MVKKLSGWYKTKPSDSSSMLREIWVYATSQEEAIRKLRMLHPHIRFNLPKHMGIVSHLGYLFDMLFVPSRPHLTFGGEPKKDVVESHDWDEMGWSGYHRHYASENIE